MSLALLREDKIPTYGGAKQTLEAADDARHRGLSKREARGCGQGDARATSQPDTAAALVLSGSATSLGPTFSVPLGK